MWTLAHGTCMVFRRILRYPGICISISLDFGLGLAYEQYRTYYSEKDMK